MVGCPRSGTSWVRNILNGHPQVHCGPESHLCPVVHEALHDPRSGWFEVMQRFDSYSHRQVGPHRWIDRDKMQQLVEWAAASGDEPLTAADDLVAAVFQHYAVRRRLGAETVLVEKTPNHIFHADRLLARFAGSVVIEVRRDGRDVCVSLERRAQRVAWPPAERSAQIAMWTNAVSHGLRLSADPAFAGRWYVLHYEELIADRHGAIARLFDVLGLDAPFDLVRSIAESNDISRQAIVGDGEHVRKGIVGDWQNHFTVDDARLFEQLAGPVFAAAGYPR